MSVILVKQKLVCRECINFAISEFLFFIAQRFETEVIAQRLETEVSECGVLLDNECRSLHSPRAQISQVDVDANCECKSMRSVYSEKKPFRLRPGGSSGAKICFRVVSRPQLGRQGGWARLLKRAAWKETAQVSDAGRLRRHASTL